MLPIGFQEPELQFFRRWTNQVFFKEIAHFFFEFFRFLRENIQEFAFADENELCAEDENYREKSMQPYNLLRREDLAELLQKNPEEIVVLDCRYGFEFEGSLHFNEIF